MPQSRGMFTAHQTKSLRAFTTGCLTRKIQQQTATKGNRSTTKQKQQKKDRHGSSDGKK